VATFTKPGGRALRPAALAWRDAAFEELGLDRLIAFVHPANTRSPAAVSRLGMMLEDFTRDPNLGHRLHVYSLRPPRARVK
jgi:RimJ/RimL family protein N-acetyltransferase